MKKFEVTISRSATEYVIVHVEAVDADAAEDAVNDALGQSRKVTLNELIATSGIAIVETGINGDDESEWETCASEEATADNAHCEKCGTPTTEDTTVYDGNHTYCSADCKERH